MTPLVFSARALRIRPLVKTLGRLVGPPPLRAARWRGEAVVPLDHHAAPHVRAVSGRRAGRLRGDGVIEMAPPLGVFNLHTGASPYYKGGPNCTLWCLANREPWAVGATNHALDAGVDSGAPVRTGRVEVADATAAGPAVDAVALGHDLYAEALARYARRGRPTPTPQRALGEGRTYDAREWTGRSAGAAQHYVASGGPRDWAPAGRPTPGSFRLVDAFSD